MGNRLAPGCCCQGCDILDVTFDTTVETSWVKVFDLYNSSDLLVASVVGDALGTFVEGDYLLSKSLFPFENFAVDFTQLVPVDWWDTSGNTLVVEFVDIADVVRLKIQVYPERDSVTNGSATNYFHFLRASVSVRNAAGTVIDSDIITIKSYGGPIATPPTEFNFDIRGFGLVARDKCVEIGSVYNASGYAAGDAMSTYSVDENPANTVTRSITNVMKRHPVFFDDSFPTCKMKISTLGDDVTFDSIFAEKIYNLQLSGPSEGYYSTAGGTAENAACVDTATCSIIPPYSHVMWNIDDISITGMTSPVLFNRVFNGCGGVVQMRDDTSLPTFVFDDTQAVGSKYSFSTYTATKAFTATATMSVVEHDADEVDITVKLTIQYLSVPPFTGTNSISGLFTGFVQVNVTGTYPLLNGFWQVSGGTSKVLEATVRVPKWFGRDFPPVTIPGTDFAVTGETSGRSIWALSSSSIADAGWNAFGNQQFTINRQNQEFSVDDLSVTIGVRV